MSEPSITKTTDDKRLPWWLWPQVVSADAPLVTMLWLAVLAHSHRIHLPVVFYGGLGLVTWLVYVVDRTADAMSGRLGDPVSARHAFCYRHRWVTLILVLPLGGLAVGWLALAELPVGLLWQGMTMAMLGAVYLACFAARKAAWLRVAMAAFASIVGLVLIGGSPLSDGPKIVLFAVLVSVMRSVVVGQLDQRWFSLLPKEVLAALLIALGCSAGVHFWVPDDHAVFCVEVKLLWALFFTNLMGIACSEVQAGRHVDPDSLMQIQPWLVSKHLWLVAAVVVGGLCVAVTTVVGRGAPGVTATAVVVAASAGLHGVLHLYVRRLSPELYHLLADVALILPVPLIWMLPQD